MKARIGIASAIADFSGCEIAHDLGAISPTTRCRNVTMISANANDSTYPTALGSPLNSGSSMWWKAGLEIAPRAKVHKVIPSWEPASNKDRSRALLSAARAEALVDAACSSR